MKKWQIVVSVICLILCIVSLIFAVFYKKEKNKNTMDAYIVLDNNTNYGYSNKKGFSIISDKELVSLNLLFTVFDNNKNIGKYYLSKANSWNLFDQNDNYTAYNGYMFAYYGNIDILTYDVNFRNINEEEKNLLKNNYKISNFNHLLTNEVYDVDLNSNGIADKIICLSNSDLDIPKSERYNLIVAIIDGKIKTIAEYYNVENADIYKIKKFFSINDKDFKYIVVERIENYDGDIESYSVDDRIYEYNNNTYKEVTTK